MEDRLRYPVLDVDLEAVRKNAAVMCRFCKSRGIDVAGVIKFSDGDLEISKAYAEGGCSQIASSRTVHLERIKKNMPEITTMLIRIPMISEAEEAVKWADISLNSEETVLRALNEAAGKIGKRHSVILMQDVGDRREGVIGTQRLTELAMITERELEHLHLMGIGSSFACVSGVLPDWDNLSRLADSAERIEELIGRKLEIAALGSQDIGNAMLLVPKDPGVSIVGGSSDHTVLDVTDSGRDWKPGDTIRFGLFYMPLLYCFATRHVAIRYTSRV